MFGKTVFAASVIMIASFGSAMAQSPEQLERFDAWGTYSFKSGNKTICYVLSAPQKSEPSTVTHGDNFFLVSQKTNGASGFEPQFRAGYTLKPNSQVTVSIDGKNFAMFTKESAAWLVDPAQETQLVAAMKAGSNLTIKAVSLRGTNTSYTYSLKGVTAALNKAQKCK